MRMIARTAVNKAYARHGCREYKSWFYNFFHKQRGIIQEEMAIRSYEKFTNCKLLDKQKLVRIHSDMYTVTGRIDGFSQGRCVEVKCRSSNLKEIPVWELDQLALYCHALNAPGALVEFNNGRLRVTEYTASFLAKRASVLLGILEHKVSEIQQLVKAMKQ